MSKKQTQDPTAEALARVTPAEVHAATMAADGDLPMLALEYYKYTHARIMEKRPIDTYWADMVALAAVLIAGQELAKKKE